MRFVSAPARSCHQIRAPFGTLTFYVTVVNHPTLTDGAFSYFSLHERICHSSTDSHQWLFGGVVNYNSTTCFFISRMISSAVSLFSLRKLFAFSMPTPNFISPYENEAPAFFTRPHFAPSVTMSPS